MGNITGRIIRLLNSERGAALAEWGLLVVLIAVVALVAVTLAGDQVSDTYSSIADELVGI
jgi:pilus assembly protein Flp/PilA